MNNFDDDFDDVENFFDSLINSGFQLGRRVLQLGAIWMLCGAVPMLLSPEPITKILGTLLFNVGLVTGLTGMAIMFIPPVLMGIGFTILLPFMAFTTVLKSIYEAPANTEQNKESPEIEHHDTPTQDLSHVSDNTNEQISVNPDKVIFSCELHAPKGSMLPIKQPQTDSVEPEHEHTSRKQKSIS
ncbi:MAG: hypothetical protein FJ161_02640 [Gammaproteobacteria bacterium]|nr:hypothetical protein [Gammaproteobacteria bacterium]